MTKRLIKLEEQIKQAGETIKLMESNGKDVKKIKKLYRIDIKKLNKLKRV